MSLGFTSISKQSNSNATDSLFFHYEGRVGLLRGKEEIERFTKGLSFNSTEDRQIRHNLRTVQFGFKCEKHLYPEKEEFERVRLTLSEVKNIMGDIHMDFKGFLLRKKLKGLEINYDNEIRNELESSQYCSELSQVVGRLIILMQMGNLDEKSRDNFYNLQKLSNLYFGKGNYKREDLFERKEKSLERKLIKFLMKDKLSELELVLVAVFFRQKVKLYIKKNI